MEKRKGPRLLTMTLPQPKRPFLELAGHRCALHSLGHEGFEAWAPSTLPISVRVGAKLDGEVVIDQGRYPVQLEVIHLEKRVVGLSVLQGSKELSEILNRLLEPTHYAHKLKSMPESERLDSEFGLPRLWYVGEGESELLVWYNDLTLMMLGIQVCCMGHWVYRYQFESPQTGDLKAHVTRGHGKVIKDSELLLRHPAPSRPILDFAAQFLSSVPQPLVGHLLWQFLETGEQVYLPRDMFSGTKVA